MFESVLAGLKIVGDLRESLVRGFLGKRFENDGGGGLAAEIIEQCLHLLVKQRQPVLHARGAAAFTHRFVEHVVGRRGAERRHIAGAKAPDGVAGELELGHGHELERAQFLGGALRFRIEAANGFERVAEKVEPHRRIDRRRKQIDNAAAHGVVARLAHGGGTVKAVELEPLGDARHRQ